MRNYLLIALLALTGCGAEYEYPKPPAQPVIPAPKPIPIGVKAVIAAFGAPWCGPCKAAMPELNSLYKALSADQKSKIEFRLYVITGSTATSRPDELTTQSYKNQYAPLAIGISDTGQKNFRAMIRSNAIPSAAVLGQDGKVLKVFEAGAEFLPKQVVEFAVLKAGL